MKKLNRLLLDKNFMLTMIAIIFIVAFIIWKNSFKNSCIKNGGKLVENSDFSYSCLYEKVEN